MRSRDLRHCLIIGVFSLLLPMDLPAEEENASPALSDAQEAMIITLCTNLSMMYGDAINVGDYEGLPELFSEDGVWDILGNHLVGRKAIKDFWKSRIDLRNPKEEKRHVITNHRIDVIDEFRARGTSLFTIYRFNKSPQSNDSLSPWLFTRSKDEYVKTGQGWRIQKRVIKEVAQKNMALNHD